MGPLVKLLAGGVLAGLLAIGSLVVLVINAASKSERDVDATCYEMERW
jgi:hypothetical protein